MRKPPVSLQSAPALLCAFCAITFSAGVQAFEWKDLWQRKDQQARELLESGNAAQAAEVFSDPRWRGVSQHRAGNYKQAIDEFNVSSDAPSRYNRGVAQVMEGEYQAAVESFESVLEEQPGNEDAAHNLAIAKALLQQEQQQQQKQEQSGDSDQQQDGEESSSESDQSDSSDGENSESQDSESAQQERQSSQEQSGEPSSADSQAEQQPPSSDEQSADSETGKGELSEDVQKLSESGDGQPDEKAEEALRQAMNAQTQEEPSEETEQQNTAVGSAESQSLSEENQATEQWLRRIPDDPSQLLRNKIKLNHMIEHPNVGDTAQPW